MSELSSSPFSILSCTLGITGWIVTFVGLCASHTFAQSVSWWIITYELFVLVMACTVLWANSSIIYYPVILTLIAISIPYSTNEVMTYISSGKASFTAAASGYIIMMVTQFIWIFLFGIQQDASMLRSFSDLNHHYHNRIYSNADTYKPGDRRSNNSIVYGNNMVRDLGGPSYPPPIPTQVSYQTSVNQDQHMVSVPMFMSPPTEDTVFLSPHYEYLIPVIAIHNYQASNEDPNELSFSKGELLYVHDKKGSWWQAKKANGVIGMIPSNYVREQKLS